jgi:hypothetical protein
MLGLLVITASLLATIVGIAAARTAGPAAHRWSRWLRWTALGTAVVIAAFSTSSDVVRNESRFSIA